eukprot:scaffold5335_cov99-Amphora_coffeaeformis.AAC.1
MMPPREADIMPGGQSKTTGGSSNSYSNWGVSFAPPPPPLVHRTSPEVMETTSPEPVATVQPPNVPRDVPPPPPPPEIFMHEST